MLSKELFQSAARQIQMDNWNEIAHRWNDGREHNGLSVERVQLIEPHLKSPVLLVGAGQGHVLEKLSERLGDVTGLDWSSEMLARAKSRGVANLVEGDAGNLPFADETFQTVIISTGVLLPTHEAERTRTYIREACRVVSRAGTIIVCIFYEKDSEEARKKAQGVAMPADTVRCFLFWDLSMINSILEENDRQILETIVDQDVALIVIHKD